MGNSDGRRSVARGVAAGARGLVVFILGIFIEHFTSSVAHFDVLVVSQFFNFRFDAVQQRQPGLNVSSIPDSCKWSHQRVPRISYLEEQNC